MIDRGMGMSKIEKNNFTINMGTDNPSRTQQKEDSKTGRKTIFAGDLNSKTDRILTRKNQLQKKAMKVLTDQFEKDGKTDNAIKNAENKLDSLKEEATLANEGKIEARRAKEAIMKEYGITEDSEEHKQLELIRKVRKVMRGGSGSITAEELEQVSSMGNLTDYQQRMLAYDDMETVFQDRLDEIDKGIKEESSSIKGLKISILKQHGMDDAVGDKAEMLASAAKEIAGMLYNEAKDKIQEEWDEMVEKAKEAAEKKKAEEAKAEAKKEEQEVQGEETKQITEDVSSVKQEMDKMLREAKLLEEDFKGIVVDSQL